MAAAPKGDVTPPVDPIDAFLSEGAPQPKPVDPIDAFLNEGNPNPPAAPEPNLFDRITGMFSTPSASQTTYTGPELAGPNVPTEDPRPKVAQALTDGSNSMKRFFNGVEHNFHEWQSTVNEAYDDKIKHQPFTGQDAFGLSPEWVDWMSKHGLAPNYTAKADNSALHHIAGAFTVEIPQLLDLGARMFLGAPELINAAVFGGNKLTGELIEYKLNDEAAGGAFRHLSDMVPNAKPETPPLVTPRPVVAPNATTAPTATALPPRLAPSVDADLDELAAVMDNPTGAASHEAQAAGENAVALPQGELDLQGAHTPETIDTPPEAPSRLSDVVPPETVEPPTLAVTEAETPAQGKFELRQDELNAHHTASGGKMFQFGIFDRETGQQAGYADVRMGKMWNGEYDPGLLWVDMVQATKGGPWDHGGALAFGGKETRALLPELQKRFPEMTRIGGFRVSGARARTGRIGNVVIDAKTGKLLDFQPAVKGLEGTDLEGTDLDPANSRAAEQYAESLRIEREVREFEETPPLPDDVVVRLAARNEEVPAENLDGAQIGVAIDQQLGGHSTGGVEPLLAETARTTPPTLFHGASNSIGDLAEYDDFNHPLNPYGPAFRTVNDANQAMRNAGRSRRDAVVYDVDVRPDIGLFDMEKPLGPGELRRFDRLFDGEPELQAVVREVTAQDRMTGKAFFDALREDKDAETGQAMPKEMYDEIVQTIRDDLAQSGYRGFRYLNDRGTGIPHEGRDYWFPEEDLVIRPRLPQPNRMTRSSTRVTTQPRRVRRPARLGEAGSVEEESRLLTIPAAALTLSAPLTHPSLPMVPHGLTREESAILHIAEEPKYFDHPLTDTKGNINLENIQKPGDVHRIIRAISRSNGGFEERRRGVVSHAETVETAKALGISAEEFQRRGVGSAFSAEELTSLRHMLVGSALKLRELAGAVKIANSDANIFEFTQAITRHVLLQETVAGATAEAGRALNAMKIFVGDTRDALDLGEHLKEMGGRRRWERAADEILKSRTTTTVSRVVKSAVKPDFWDKTQEWFVNSILASIRSNEVNILGNIHMQFDRMVNKPLTIGIAKALKATGMSKAEGNLYWGEMYHGLTQTVGGFTEGLMNSARQLANDGAPFGRFQGGLRPHAPAIGNEAFTTNRAAILAGKIIRKPTELMGAVDVIFKDITGNTRLGAMAYRTAMDEASAAMKAAGLSEADVAATMASDAFRTSVANRITELKQNPTKDMIADATKEAAYQVFQTPNGAWTNSMLMVMQRAKPMRLLIPFVTTTTNILKRTAERSPLAVLALIKSDSKMAQTLKGARGLEEQATAMARIATGSALLTVLTYWAANGDITGPMPRDPKKAAQLYALGWRPNSIKVGDSYIPSYPFGVLGNLMTMAAEAHSTFADVKSVANGEADSYIDAVRNNMLDAAFEMLDNSSLRAFGDLVTALNDRDGRKLDKFTANFATSFVPAFIRQGAKAEDPYVRKSSNILEDMEQNLPMTRYNLEPKLDWRGRPIPNANRGLADSEVGRTAMGLVNPFTASELTDDPVEKSLYRLGIHPKAPDAKIANVDLNPEDTKMYQESYGQAAYANLRMMGVGQPGWEKIPAKIQAHMILHGMSAAKRLAKNKTIANSKDDLAVKIAKDKADLNIPEPTDDLFDQ
jgi:hypothetical protein